MKIIVLFSILFSTIIFSQESRNNWFIFNPGQNLSQSRIKMDNWLDTPAGNHGFLKYNGDDLQFEDGTPIKFWGVNICSARPYSENTVIEKWVETLSAFGINGVRFHKYTYHGMPDSISTDIAEEKYEQLDYFHFKLKEKGIYYGWSPVYGHKPRKADSDKLVSYEEIKNADLGNHLSGSTIGLVNFAEDLQDIQIELVVNMLNHKNPFTGLKYADDPALAFIEFQNEDNIFFATTETMLAKCLTYKKLLTDRFCDWLVGKYQSPDKLKLAWGKTAFEWGIEVKSIEWDLNDRNITPVANHGIYDYEFKKYQKLGQPMPVFLLDMARFLYEQQIAFYQRFEDSIRATGYKGVLVGSCWQAGSGISHYYNLSADYIAGMIDRHNYFGGGTGHRLVSGKMKNASMLKMPGSGLLSTGMQQVKNRPFSISEWLSLIPNEYCAEGNPIIAAYGMGLQGWDASFSFASDFTWFTKTLHTPGVYNVMSPLQLSLYPALARMVYRNEIKEGATVSVRNVHVPSLIDGELGFAELIEQSHDVKEFDGDVPKEALAVGKVLVDFSDEFIKTEKPDLSNYIDLSLKKIKSNTGQLEWDYSDEGYFSINSESTQGVVGLTNKEKIVLPDFTIQTDNNFAIVLITTYDKNSFTETNKAFITTIARAVNKGMIFNDTKTELLNTGEAPIFIEPVISKISGVNKKIITVKILDHIGCYTGKTVEVNNNSAYLNGEEYKTMYYEIEYE